MAAMDSTVSLICGLSSLDFFAKSNRLPFFSNVAVSSKSNGNSTMQASFSCFCSSVSSIDIRVLSASILVVSGRVVIRVLNLLTISWKLMSCLKGFTSFSR